MVDLLNIINSISDSNVVFYILVIILVIVCIAMVYLIYSQNKEMASELKRRKLEDELNFEEEEEVDDNSKMVFPVEHEEEENEEQLEVIKAEDEFEKDESLENTINDILGVDEQKEVISSTPIEEEEEPVIEEDKEDIETQEERRKVELLDATMTDIPRQSILEETQTAIPGLLETVNEDDILQELTKDLAAGPIERNVELTPYEEQQEKEAIISYDELVNNKDNGIVYNKEIEDNNVSYKQVDLEKTAKIDTEEINKKMAEEKEITTSNNYDYEESFLKNLKKLQKEVNG